MFAISKQQGSLLLLKHVLFLDYLLDHIVFLVLTLKYVKII